MTSEVGCSVVGGIDIGGGVNEKTHVTISISEMKYVQWASLNRTLLPNDVTDWVDLDIKDRLRNSIINNGVIAPIAVWQSGDDTVVLKGVGFLSLLDELEIEGVSVPREIPAYFVNCPNEVKAKEFALVLRSKYRHVQMDGLVNWIREQSFDWGELRETVRFADLSEARLETKLDFYDTANLSDEDNCGVDVHGESVVVQSGDIFVCVANGVRHVIGCGDVKDDVFLDELFMKHLYRGQGVLGNMVFTDSPYNLKTSFFCHNNDHTDFKDGGGEMTDEEFIDFIARQYEVACRYTIKGAIHYYCMDFRHIAHMGIAAKRVYGSYTHKQVCVWRKSNWGNGDFYRAQYELIFVNKNGDAPHKSYIGMKDRVRSNVWEYPIASSFSNPDRDLLSEHPTPKPIGMYIDAMLDVSDEGDYILDFFSGSGTCLSAAQRVERNSGSLDIEPKYVQGSVLRWIRTCVSLGLDWHVHHVNGDVDFVDLYNNKKTDGGADGE